MIRGQTFIGYGWRCDNNICIVFVFEPLSEDVHVQRTKKSKSTALSQGGRRFPLNTDTPVCQRKLFAKLYVVTLLNSTNHCTLFMDSSSLGKSLDSTGYIPAKTWCLEIILSFCRGMNVPWPWQVENRAWTRPLPRHDVVCHQCELQSS